MLFTNAHCKVPVHQRLVIHYHTSKESTFDLLLQILYHDTANFDFALIFAPYL